MIVRPTDLVMVNTDFKFNGFSINEIEIDLVHVNAGRKKRQKRSDFDADFISKVCIKFFSDRSLKDVGQQWFGDELCLYYKIADFFEEKKYVVVICFCSDKPNTIGVITLYQIKEK